jgi:phenylalanyl-tRNA synthetase beta chain
VALVGSHDYREVRGAVEAMLESLDAAKGVAVVPDQRPGFSSAACGRVEWGGRAIGYIGKVDAAVAHKLDLRQTPAAAELELDPLIAGVGWLPQVKELARFPAVKRDLSLVVAQRVRYQEIEAVVRNLKVANLEDVEFVTTYRGKQLGEGNKSVTLELLFRSDAATLTSEAVEGSVQQVIAAAREKLGAVLRT